MLAEDIAWLLDLTGPRVRRSTAQQLSNAHGLDERNLLQILDETYRGYQDSRWVLDAMGAVPRGREATTGMALADAQLVAAVRRTVTRDRAHFELRPYRDLTATEVAAIEHAAARFGEYAQLNAQIAMRRPR